MKWIIFGIGLLLSSTAWAKPNIIYILADDLGYGDLSCYGAQKIKTPHIDRLATEGMKFSQHYSGSTVCAPSRCSLMTGMHTGHCYVRGNKEHQPVGQEPLAASVVTVAEVLKDSGYTCGAFGKWGLGFPGSSGDPMNQGFDRFYGYNCQRNAHGYYPKHLFSDSEKVELDGKTYTPELITDECLKWIRQNHKQPFFCFIPCPIPHAAMHAPEELVEPYRKQFPEFNNVVGRYGKNEPYQKNPVAAFAAMMEIFDNDVGKVLGLLVELGIDDNTIVMFTSDNGPHREGGHKPDFFDSNGPLNGYKRNLTEGGIRVPMLARWPGKIAPGSTTDHISAFWDFFPTACDIAGIDTPNGLDGISFLPALTGKPQQAHKYMYWEFFEQGGKLAVREGPWKAIQRNVHKQPNGPVLLFNLDNDLGETTNLAEKHPEVLARLKGYMREAHTKSEIFVWGAEKKKKSGK